MANGLQWHEKGQKKIEGNYKDELSRWQNGLEWYENGQKWSENIFKDGKKDGKWTEQETDGQIRVKENYKDDKKQSEKNYKDGKEDGKWTFSGLGMVR